MKAGVRSVVPRTKNQEPIPPFLHHLLSLSLEAAPWLLFGLVVAGLVRAFMPAGLVGRWLGGEGPLAPVIAALVGTPVPVCSCGVLPIAVGLRRQGASRGAVSSFLVATPENGVDSIAVSWALLGPFMTVVRPVAAILSAVATGWLVMLTPARAAAVLEEAKQAGCCDGPAKADGGGEDGGCCDEETCGDDAGVAADEPLARRLAGGIRYAMSDLLDDIVGWLAVGLVLAAAVAAFAPEAWLAEWGSGMTGKLVMLAVGLPMYICATASTPVAAALLLAGVSPGTVLVFLLAGPATNVATLGVLRRELGGPATAAFLVGIVVTTVGLGMATDAVATRLAIDVVAEAAVAGRFVPAWIAVASAVVIVLMAIRPLRRRLPGAFRMQKEKCRMQNAG